MIRVDEWNPSLAVHCSMIHCDDIQKYIYMMVAATAVW